MTNNQSLFQRPRKNRTFHVMALLYVASMGIFLPVIFAFDFNMLFYNLNINTTNVIREIILSTGKYLRTISLNRSKIVSFLTMSEHFTSVSDEYNKPLFN